jgi:crotonobetaine/carnitine-CoA ligase
MKTYQDMRLTFADDSMWSLPRVLRARSKTHGERVYLEIPSAGVRLTYREVLDLAERTASGLIAAGGSPGDRVLIMAPNSLSFMAAWFGAACAGMVEAPIHTALRGSFLRHQVATLAPRFAVIDSSFAQWFTQIPEACGGIRTFFLVGGRQECAAAMAVLESAGMHGAPFESLFDAERVHLPDVEPADLGAILFTSGTTGPSKGVMMPHAQMYFFADQTVSLTRLTEADIYMSVGPLFHGNAQFVAAYPAMLAGARFVLRERFSANQWLPWVRECGATVTNLLGVMADFVWNQSEQPNDAENALRCLFTAPTPPNLIESFKRRFGVEALVEAYGMTECSVPIVTPYGEPRPVGSSGVLVADYFDIRIVNPRNDEEVPEGEVGEALVRPKVPWTTCQGYFGMPDRTAEAFRNLWLHTGDGLRRDADGWYYFVDRLKDTIRRRGENISSYEVEQAILPHPGVAECAAVAVPADEGGEDEVMLVIVPSPSAPSVEELWDWCDEHLPSFVAPRYITFVDALPKTPNEKIRKHQLRDAGVGASTADRGSLRTRLGGDG